jgi:hypothetical protein
VELHALVVMSNHWHAVVTDAQGRLPEFLAEVHRTVARCRNAALGRTENFWSSEQPSVVLLAEPADVIDKIAYVIANPVAAGLVASPQQWPGVVSTQLCQEWTVERPGVYFRENGPLPERVTVRLTRPRILQHKCLADLQRLVDAALDDQLRLAHAQLREQGSEVVGAEKVLAQSSARTASSRETLGGRVPRIAAKTQALRQILIEQLRAWQRRYRAAYDKWRTGVRDVLFPPGTYSLRIHAGAQCAPS